jgi:hypothetical protein
MAEQLHFIAFKGNVAVPQDVNWIYNVSVPTQSPTLVPRWRAWKYDGTLIYNEQNIIEVGLFLTPDLARSACQEDYEAGWLALNTPPPTVTTLTPNTGAANTSIMVTIVGTGFDAGVVAYVVLSDGATINTIGPEDTATDIQFTINLLAENILNSGTTVQIGVENSNGVYSDNTLPFTVT